MSILDITRYSDPGRVIMRTLWQVKIERLVGTLEDPDPAGFPALARELHEVLREAPPRVAAALGEPCSRDRLDRLLDAGATREAAFELIGRAQYMMSRGGEGQVIASVVAEDLFFETTLSARHESTAFAGALAIGLRAFASTAPKSSRSPVSH